ANRIAAVLAHHFGRASAPRDQLSHGVRRCAEQPAAGRHHQPPALARYPRRLRLGWLGWLGFQQYARARRPVLRSAAEQSELLSGATALVVKTRRVAAALQLGRYRTWAVAAPEPVAARQWRMSALLR